MSLHPILHRRNSDATGLLAGVVILATNLLTARASDLEYKTVPDWLTLPPGRTQLGNLHGDVAVSSKGEIYVSVQDPKAGVQVFAPDGRFLRLVPNAPSDFHGFVIRRIPQGEFIFGARLAGQTIVKMTLDGDVVLTIPGSAIPDEFKNKDPKTGAPKLALTGMDVAPNGDLFVTDGYASDYVHRFDANGKYLKSFGGRKPPYNFKTLHKIAIDTRFEPARIIACDRANMRVVHLSLDGDFLGVVADDLRLPAAVAIYKDDAVIGELNGRVTILDKAGAVVAHLGEYTGPGVGGNQLPPDKWQPGIVVSPHGVALDDRGNLYVAEYSIYGRIDRFDRQ